MLKSMIRDEPDLIFILHDYSPYDTIEHVYSLNTPFTIAIKNNDQVLFDFLIKADDTKILANTVNEQIVFRYASPILIKLYVSRYLNFIVSELLKIVCYRNEQELFFWLIDTFRPLCTVAVLEAALLTDALFYDHIVEYLNIYEVNVLITAFRERYINLARYLCFKYRHDEQLMIAAKKYIYNMYDQDMISWFTENIEI